MMNFEMPPGGDVEVEKYRLENEKPEMSTTCESFKIMIHEKKNKQKKNCPQMCDDPSWTTRQYNHIVPP